jgi:hypothetical protein
MGQLSGSISIAERYQLAREAGFSAPDAIVMAAISMAECANCDMSRGYGDPVKQAGKLDHGLWQINDVHGFSSAYLADPLNNAKAAYTVWKGGGFKAWCTYPGGCGGGAGVPNFGALLTAATVAAGQVDPSAPAQVDVSGSGTAGQGSLQSGPDTNMTGSVAAGGSVAAPSLFGNQALGSIVAHLGSQGFWWAVLLFGLALAGIVAGVVIYFKADIAGALRAAA